MIPEKPPSPTPIIEEAVQKALEQAHENRLENKDLDELDALEDEEDETFLEKYKQDSTRPIVDFILTEMIKAAKVS